MRFLIGNSISEIYDQVSLFLIHQDSVTLCVMQLW